MCQNRAKTEAKNELKSNNETKTKIKRGMTLVFASGPLYAALHQPICVVVVSVLPASPWPVAVLVAFTSIL